MRVSLAEIEIEGLQEHVRSCGTCSIDRPLPSSSLTAITVLVCAEIAPRFQAKLKREWLAFWGGAQDATRSTYRAE